jgi:hypothetical protein
MPEQPAPDELVDYLRGGSDVSCQYRRESSPAPPPSLDRSVLESAGSLKSRTPFKPQSLAPFAFAASVLLSLAMVLAVVFGPQVKKADDSARVVRVHILKSEAPRAAPASPRERNPALWLQDINALRRAGRGNQADVELRRFRSVYPDYIVTLSE